MTDRVLPSPRAVVRPLRSANQQRFSTRLRGTYVLFVVLVVALGVRLAFIQLGSGAYYGKLSVEQVSTTITTPSLRGAIYDRSGNVLAISAPTSLVVADDFQVTDPSQLAAALAPYLNVGASILRGELSRKSGYVVLDPNLSIAAGHRLAAQEFPGVVVLSSSIRTEPNGTLAESLLGGVNATGVGSSGLEYQYQALLAGQTGSERVFASPSGINLPGTHVTVLKKSVAGVGLELTIDAPLQYVAEQDLARQLRATGGVSGVALVMDVKTGQILADSSLVNTAVHAGALGPISNWGQSVGVPHIDQTVNNLGFTSVYEPGSVFKVVPFSAALSAGLIKPTTAFTVPYSVDVGGRTFHDADQHPTETLTTTQILSQSSNIGTYEIAHRVGESRLLAQVARLGFGESTGLNFPGESSGLLVNASGWAGSDLAALPIGQVDAVPPIQVLDAYNAIANGGLFVKPQLVRGTVSVTGQLTPAPASPTRTALSPTVAHQLTSMLEQVVLDGTGVEAEIPGYLVAGKTGTSQIPTPGQQSYLPGAYDASFVGFAPADNPVLSMLVMIQRPESQIYGGSVAAPVFQEVMSYALHHYGVPATGPATITRRSPAAIASDVT